MQIVGCLLIYFFPIQCFASHHSMWKNFSDIKNIEKHFREYFLPSLLYTIERLSGVDHAKSLQLSENTFLKNFDSIKMLRTNAPRALKLLNTNQETITKRNSFKIDIYFYSMLTYDLDSRT